MSNTKIKAGQFYGVIGNGTNGYFLVSDGNGGMSWISNIVNPTITNVDYPGTATAADPAGGESITLTGTGFKTGATVTIGGTAAPWSLTYRLHSLQLQHPLKQLEITILLLQIQIQDPLLM